MIGSRALIPTGAFGRFLEVSKVKPCPDGNQGPKLRWFADRGAYYVTWTVGGRSRKCSTGTADSEAAQIFFADWLQLRGKRVGPSDPAETLVTDILFAYATEHGPRVGSASHRQRY